MANIFERLMSAPVEDEVLEWKEHKTQIDSNKLGQYFSALSNEANLNGKKYAHLILGVKNDKHL